MPKQDTNGRQATCRPKPHRPACSLHPLFFAVGIFYALKGELFLFLISFLVAVQHECAHAFAASKLGYTLNKIVLMPFGAVIDGDMRGLSVKDEISIALWGPFCNLLTAGFFVALWWFAPTMYAFTDTAVLSSLSIALVNLLPAYPLDGGRVLRCLLVRTLAKKHAQDQAERRAQRICRGLTVVFALALLIVFFLSEKTGEGNFSLLTFSIFLFVGAFGNGNEKAVYERMDFSCEKIFARGAELKRVAILHTCPIKDTFRFLSRGCFLVLEVYDEQERKLFELSQNELSQFFTVAKTPYQSIGEIYIKIKNTP